ncbi:predicted protein [Chaetomium globosum CBS 148.51]|uniref:MARVEL domain-containing protein n=1 Tax=Chaetomium globosum (strain ATCC 6205 / CBS 148.51 / DSM 1962 / NBRC 6347 / NRRL 1970) TaxID=306901 RepID=Q2H380_CHAGB|nr:uncharacterized protein CHGG_03766 [Chaetomium globosum CBS 148.51]EAQ87147.1 predicted protein [Chaetomium globosum CBS 148.51]
MLKPITLGLRGLYFVMALTILALAAAMIANQVYDTPPVTTRYSTFTGGFGMIVAGVGVLCTFVSFVPELVPLVLDGLAALFFLGGGIAWAYGLKDTSNCSNYETMLYSPLLNQGSIKFGDKTGYGVAAGEDATPESIMSALKGNCQRAQADEILQFLCFGLGTALVGLGFLQRRRGGGMHSGAYVA